MPLGLRRGLEDQSCHQWSAPFVEQDAAPARVGPGVRGDLGELTTCPWCGSAINEARDIRVDLDRRRTLLFCGDVARASPFQARRQPDHGLPVLVVDEKVYRL